MQDDRMIRIEDKVDRLGERLSSIDSTLAAQHVSLKAHMRRTELLEKALEPIKSHVSIIEALFKIFGAIGFIVALTSGIMEVAKYFRG